MARTSRIRGWEQAAERYEAALGRLRSDERELIIARVELDMSYQELAIAMEPRAPTRRAWPLYFPSYGLAGSTVIVTVASPELRTPSLTRNVNVSVPLKPASGT